MSFFANYHSYVVFVLLYYTYKSICLFHLIHLVLNSCGRNEQYYIYDTHTRARACTYTHIRNVWIVTWQVGLGVTATVIRYWFWRSKLAVRTVVIWSTCLRLDRGLLLLCLCVCVLTNTFCDEYSSTSTVTQYSLTCVEGMSRLFFVLHTKKLSSLRSIVHSVQHMG